MRLPFLLISLIILGLAAPAPAMDMANCHCFRQRSFDAARPDASDPYLLASSYNALVARTFGISKQQIIYRRMQGGIGADDLLLGLYISHFSKKPLEVLLSIRDNGGTWTNIAASARIGRNQTDPAGIAAAAEVRAMVRNINDWMMRVMYDVSDAELQRLRSFHFQDREIALLLALARQCARPIDELIALRRDQSLSWSALADQCHLSPRQVGANILHAQ